MGAVAEKLKQGISVVPENYEAVTIYFSDIVGFTTIAKASTPLEVVAFLNNMYTLFDSISAKHDVYKVETIGDEDMKVELRSGVHTGNVVAGVVGVKMPRYCLFGESVQIASSMESGGIPSRIQVSGTTEKILKRLGGYRTEYRHEVENDLCGVLSTFWLNGKAGFNEPLPDYAAEL